MQRNESAGGRDTNEPHQVVLRGMLGEEVSDTPSEAEAMTLKEMKDKLAWHAKYIDMLEDLICHYQREINFWKTRE
jgi:hypothetical protein